MLRIFTRSRRMPPGPGSIISSGFGQAGQHPVAVGFVASFCQSREGGFRIRLPCCCLCVTPFPSDADSNAKSCPSPNDRSGSSGPFFFCCAGKAKDRTGRQQAGMCQQQTLAGLMLLCALYRRRACAPGAAAHIRLRRTKRVMCAANTRLMPAYRFRPPLHVSFVCFSSPRAY